MKKFYIGYIKNNVFAIQDTDKILTFNSIFAIVNYITIQKENDKYVSLVFTDKQMELNELPNIDRINITLSYLEITKPTIDISVYHSKSKWGQSYIVKCKHFIFYSGSLEEIKKRLEIESNKQSIKFNVLTLKKIQFTSENQPLTGLIPINSEDLKLFK